ncbi:MAG: IPT/TIG domain-containing protein [Deltaproteobacteria bacterium]|nr:IPT/TIG domain-containing protein [Deltaproteobacteria bacterium]
MRGLGLRATFVALLASLGACIASAPTGIRRQTDGDGGSGGGFLATTADGASETAPSAGAGSSEPHAVLGVTPPHGPFVGGQTVLVSGKGFTPEVRVFFGEVEATGAVTIDPTKAQVVAPPHPPGPVDVTTQNGDDESTRRTLPGAYTYDPLTVDPDTGPVAGGTVVTIKGLGNHWDQEASVEASIDGKLCLTTTVVGPDAVTCTAPKGTPGSKTVSVVATSATVSSFDAFTYQDSADGFKGGLSGKTLAGKLTVLAFDNFTGDALVGAHVIVGDDATTGLYQQANANGVATFKSSKLDGKATVTVAAYCHAPITFVDVSVDTVTVYLDPTLTPACAGSGDPPPVGGKPVLTGTVQGELVWPKAGEFKKGEWTNVPPPANADEERVAFLFFATRDRARKFQLPSESNAVFESSPGDIGYGFKVSSVPGYQAMYALAGIRNKVTQKFVAYSFGATKGVAVFPGKTTESVVITMGHALDQKLVLAPSPPASNAKGPDRFHGKVVIEIAQSYFALLPDAEKTPLLPLAGPVAFVGMPPLDGDLTGMRYLALAEAVTGPQLGAPLSAVRSLSATSTSAPINVDGFVRLPVLTTPLEGTKFDGRHLAASYPTGGFPADLTIYEVLSAGSAWQVVVPGADNAVSLPDLTPYEQAGLPTGPLTIVVRGGRVLDFDYGKLTYRQLQPVGMTAYALDLFNSFL